MQTWWTVKSRGAPAAAVRNAAPNAFLLPPNLISGMHEVVIREQDGFQPQACETDLTTPDLTFHEVEGSLRVRPPTLAPLSFPERRRRPPAVRLAPGQWLRRRINFKFIRLSGGPSHFRLDTYNIHFGAPDSPDVFLGTPTRSVNELRHLH